jgi:hypothetical protein
MTQIREEYRRFAAIMADVRVLLPGEWQFENADADGRPSWCGTLTRSDGLMISANLNGDNNRVRFSPRLPQAVGGGYQSLRDCLPYDQRDEAKIEASLSLDRNPAAIARDVTRRVIEPYAALFHHVEAKAQRERDGANGMVANLAAIQAAFPGTYVRPESRPTDQSVTVYLRDTNHAYSARIDQGGNVTLEVRSIPFDVAMKALAALAKGGVA